MGKIYRGKRIFQINTKINSMKKLSLFLFIALISFSFFSVSSYKPDENQVKDNSSRSLSEGWVIKYAADTEKFYKVFFKSENLGCIFSGNFPVKRTTNGGDNWGYGTVPYLTGTNSSVFFNGSDIFMTGYMIIPSVANYSIMFRSSNMGISWDTSKISNNESGHTPYHQVSDMYKNLGYMTISWYTFPYYKTLNGGYNWLFQNVNPSPGNFVTPDKFSYVDTNVIYGVSNSYHCIGRCIAGYTNDHFVSLKDGYYSRICVVDTNNILATYKSKLFRSTNAGAVWDSTIFPVNLNSIYFTDQNTGYMTGSSGKIFKSTNKGANWIVQYTPTTDSLIECCFLNSLTGYVIGYNGVLLKTTNGGSSAFSTVSGFVRYSDNNQPVTSGKVKAFKLDKITWNVIYLDSANIQPDGSYSLPNVPHDSVDIGVFPNSNQPTDWVITYYPSTIYWEKAAVIYPTGNLSNININAYRLNSTTNNNSVNGIISGIADYPSANLKDAFLYAKNGNTFVRCTVSDAGGMYHLTSLPSGNLKIIATRLGFSRDSVNVNVTSSGNLDSINFQLHRYTVGINQISTIVPSEYKLFMNYPNPFNPSTKIKYQLKNSSFVKLEIFDALGRKIETLVNQKQTEGTYEITFDAGRVGSSSLPSGVYYYKLTAGDYSETKKMVLLK